MIVRRALWLAGAGTVLGAGGAFLLAPALRPLLVGISPANPWTLLGVPSLFLAVAVLASAAPALRATRVDPATTLRSE
jgi:ABC-type antimicrobial peptide transport system permease subunit